jgi:hypothetical protein
MTAADYTGLQLVLSGLNVLVIPALVGVMRWLMRVELRLARLEWARDPNAKADAP